ESIENAGIQTEILANESLKFDGDSKLIEMAITNLLVNAVRYSGSPKILLSAQCDENKIILSVRDFGIGIHPENSQRIFERFYRVHKERSRELGGTGLGLAIVKHTAQLHGGYAEVKSEPGKGADFRLILPFQQ
ncbi:MAG: ATP-binding protein, partial [Planctomycetia bacterium]|nr:ATP-binding protein [Planctomycetia bacterium]